MNPLIKKVVAGLAIKEAFERVQEMREPKKPSFAARVGKAGLFLTAGGGLIYLAKTGRLGPVVDQVKGMVGGGSNGQGEWHSSGQGSTSTGSSSSISSLGSEAGTESSSSSQPSGTSSS